MRGHAHRASAHGVGHCKQRATPEQGFGVGVHTTRLPCSCPCLQWKLTIKVGLRDTKELVKRHASRQGQQELRLLGHAAQGGERDRPGLVLQAQRCCQAAGQEALCIGSAL